MKLAFLVTPLLLSACATEGRFPGWVHGYSKDVCSETDDPRGCEREAMRRWRRGG